MTPFDYCERKTIEIRTTTGMISKPSWVYQELAVHASVEDDNLFSITHLPTGMIMGGGHFDEMEGAISAMMEISSITNSWAFTCSPSLEIQNLSMAIIEKFGGVLLDTKVDKKLSERELNRDPLNGIEVVA